jgi:uncharacterized protein (DUF433 family)
MGAIIESQCQTCLMLFYLLPAPTHIRQVFSIGMRWGALRFRQDRHRHTDTCASYTAFRGSLQAAEPRCLRQIPSIACDICYNIRVVGKANNGMNTQTTVVQTERGLAVAGTRITLYSIMDCVSANWPAKLIQDRYHLTERQITDVLAYIAEHRAEVEAEYQQVLRQAEETRRYWEERNRERFARMATLPPKPEHARIHAKLAAARAKRQAV